jgi:hypothetical protein
MQSGFVRFNKLSSRLKNERPVTTFDSIEAQGPDMTIHVLPGKTSPEAVGHSSQGRGRISLTVTMSVLIALISLGILRSAIATRLDSLDIDEAYHITSGVSYVRLGDYRLNPEHPPLVKLWVGMFLRPDVFQLPPLPALADKIGERHYTADAVYLINDPDIVQHRVRVAMFCLNGLLLLGFALALYRVLGAEFAIAATAFLVIDPTVAAHWPTVLTDLPIALLFSTAFLLAFSAFQSWRIGDMLLAGIALGLALGTKHSAPAVALAILTMGASMAALSRVPVRDRVLRFAYVLSVMALACTILWSFYRFRFNESPKGIDTFNRPLSAKIDDLNTPVLKTAIGAMARYHLLPRSYLWGLADVTRAGIEGRMYSIYFWNRYYIRRTPFYFFPGVVFFKLPLGQTVLIVFGLAALLSGGIGRERRAGIVAMLCFAIFLFAGLASGNSSYAGIRHALPVIPPLSIVAAGGVVYAWGSKRRWPRIICATALIGALLSAIPVVRPWEYYNELAGGSTKGYFHFNDDGAENGQRVKELAAYYHRELEPKGIVPYVQYYLFLNDEEFARRGIRTTETVWDKDESKDDSDTLTGTIIINARWLTPGPWADYGCLRNTPPTKHFGDLLIYQGSFYLPDARAWRIFFRGVAKEYDDKPDFPGAEQRFRETLQISPKLFFAGIELGNLLAARGARQEAIQVYEEALRYAPPTEDIGSVLKRQIERISTEDPKTVPPVRDPYME